MAKVKKALRRKDPDVIGLEYDGTNAQDIVTFSETEVGKPSRESGISGFLIDSTKLKYYYQPTNTAYDVIVGDWAIITRPFKTIPGTVDRLEARQVAQEWEDTGVPPTPTPDK